MIPQPSVAGSKGSKTGHALWVEAMACSLSLIRHIGTVPVMGICEVTYAGMDSAFFPVTLLCDMLASHVSEEACVNLLWLDH